MSEQRCVRSLGIAEPGHIDFFSYEEEPLREGQFRVDTLYSGFSAGTEFTFFQGLQSLSAFTLG